MRVVCLLFPALAVQLARRQGPTPVDHTGPLVLVTGAEDDATVTAASSAAYRRGVAPGMGLAEARWRSGPGLSIAQDNPGDCYDALERLASIFRIRATPFVAIGGRDHLFIRVPTSSAHAESDFACGLMRVALTWSGLTPRVTIASSPVEALEAARARQLATAPVVCPAGDHEEDFPPVRPEPIAVTVPLGDGAPLQSLRQALARLEALLAGRGEAFREVHVLMPPTRESEGDYDVLLATSTLHDPSAHPTVLLGWLAGQIAKENPPRAAVRVELDRLVPWAAGPARPALAAAS